MTSIDRISFDDGWMPHIEDGACIVTGVLLSEKSIHGREYWSIEHAKQVMGCLSDAIQRAEHELKRRQQYEPKYIELQKQRYQESQIPAWVNPKRVGS
jgi:hypothetical protein